MQAEDSVDIVAKIQYQVELLRITRIQPFGFTVAADLSDSPGHEDELRVFVVDVTPGELGHKKGTANRCAIYGHKSCSGGVCCAICGHKSVQVVFFAPSVVTKIVQLLFR